MIKITLAKNTDSSKQPSADWSTIDAFKVTTDKTLAMNSEMSLNYKVTSVPFQNMDLVLYLPHK